MLGAVPFSLTWSFPSSLVLGLISWYSVPGHNLLSTIFSDEILFMWNKFTHYDVQIKYQSTQDIETNNNDG